MSSNARKRLRVHLSGATSETALPLARLEGVEAVSVEQNGAEIIFALEVRDGRMSTARDALSRFAAANGIGPVEVAEDA